MYAGLTTADKGALIKLKESGVKITTIISLRRSANTRLKSNYDNIDIDLALAQIAEMESTEMESVEKPMTVNEWINQASVEEKAKWLSERGYCPENFFDCSMHEDCKACWKVVLNSPYTEGETK